MPIDFAPSKNCKHPEWTYGEICVQCGECEERNPTFVCVNCGRFGKDNGDWGSIEFMNVFIAPICAQCRPLFKEEDRRNYPNSYEHKTIYEYYGDFKKRK